MLSIPKKIRTLKKQQLIMLLAFSLVFALLIFSFLNFRQTSNGAPLITQSTSLPTQEYDTITLAIVGDLMCHSTQFNDAKNDSGYNFNKAFAAVKPYLSAADLCFGNLETVIAGEEEKYTGYPRFNTPAGYLDALKNAGFDITTNSNNHSLDRNFLGVQRTIDSLDSRGLRHTGTFKDAEDTAKILVVESKGIRIAVLAYTFGTNGIHFDAGKEYSVALIDSASMQRDVDRARKTGADLITAFVHWGDEYERHPNNYEKNYAGYLADLGVDLILGSHPHVLQPATILHREKKSSFVIYSLGNFFSGQRKPYTDYGMILNLQLIKNRSTGKVSTGKIQFIPTYVSNSTGFRILPVADALKANRNKDTSHTAYSPADQNRLEEIWPEVTAHMTDSTIGMFPFAP